MKINRRDDLGVCFTEGLTGAGNGSERPWKHNFKRIRNDQMKIMR